MTYTRLDKRRIHRKAKAKLGLLKQSDKDYSDFMDECISDMMDVGMNADDAEEQCQIIWDENGGED